MVAISNTRTVVRALQGVSAIASMIFISLGYIEYTSGQLSSGAAIFSTVANYSALLIAAYYVIALRWLALSTTAPRASFQRLLDGATAAALALGGVLHAMTDAKVDCVAQNIFFSSFHDGRNLFRCGSMTWGIIFTFVTAALFAITTVWSFVRDSAESTTATEEEPSVAPEYLTVATPVTKDTETTATTFNRPALRAIRLGGRAIQVGCSAAAFIFTIAGYRHYYTGQYLSPKATYSILIAYTCTLYSLWHLVIVEHFKLSRRPALKTERIGDALLAFALLLAGVVVSTSAHIANCESSNAAFKANHNEELFRCGSMSSGAVFSFIAVITYVVTIAATYMKGAVEENGRETTMTDADIQA